MTDYVNRQRQEYDADAVLLAAATKTASENGAGVHVGENAELEAQLQVRGAVSGTTPTLDVTIEEDTDAAFGSPTTIATFTQATATGVDERKKFRTSKPYVRAVATIGGTTPSFGDTECFLIGGGK